jgi:GNAT superfamily N-acetyltransferase
MVIYSPSSRETILANFEANWKENRRSWAAHPMFTIRDDDTFFWVQSSLHPSLNGVIYAKLTAANADAKIQEAINHFAKVGTPFKWTISPSSSPSDLSERLQQHGFTYSGSVPGMAMTLPKEEISIDYPPDVTIKEVTNQNRFRHWKHVLYNHREGEPLQRDITYKYQVAGAFHPGKHQFVGYWQHKPVAITSLLLSHKVAGIYSVITLPDVRRKGIGTAMTQFALREAQHAGYSIAILQASQAGINIYFRCGFHTVYEFPFYTLKA